MTTRRNFSSNGPRSSGSGPLQTDDKPPSEAESTAHPQETGDMAHGGPHEPPQESERRVEDALMESYNG